MKAIIFSKLKKKITLIATLLIPVASYSADSTLPNYTKVSGVSGNISSVGSDTLSNIMTYWAEMLRYEYPSINVQIQASGSSTAPPALTAGISHLAPMSRAMKSSEIQAFKRRYGYEPTQIRVAIDALAVFVNKDNPITGITIEQVDAIFSANLRCGANKTATRWKDLGLTGTWAGQPIQIFGRNSASGTYGHFKSKALCNGDFKSSVNEQPGSASVVQSVASSLNSIGYSGIGYRMSGVKALPISLNGSEFVAATKENAISGNYPLSRFLYVYVNKAPNKDLPPLQAEFIKLILSQQGQEVIRNNGYIAMPPEIVAQELSKLGLN